MRGRVAWVLVAAIGLVRAAHATVLVPMADATLVRASDQVLVGRVDRIESVLLGVDRVQTRVTLAVESALKGDPGGSSVVVTQPGGEVAGLRAVVFGTPSWTIGERALVFLHARADDSLTTTALALGKYTVEEADDGPRARRAMPTVDLRPLAAFSAEVAALAAGQRGHRGDGRAGAGIEPPLVATEVAEFTLQRGATGMPGRWFETDCARTITFDHAGFDAAFDEATSAAAVAQATAAWTDVDTGGITLAAGPAVPAAPTIIGGTADGRNSVVFGDPFDEAPEFTDCTGVVAVGGFIGASVGQLPETRRKVSGETFMKIFEGDVVINPGVGACLEDPRSIAEVATHEIGHAIGFGHSSEDRSETDPVKEDATMYFRVHNDGRGAAVRADDVAAVQYVYPNGLVATTPVEQAACELALGPLNVGCFDQGRLAAAPFKRMRRAAKAANKAAATLNPRKQRRLLGKALAALAKAEGAIVRFVSGECADGMRANVSRARDRVNAALATL
jgi:hypothetical protein